jgi:hypothetical protein
MTTIPATEEFWGVDSYLAFAFPLTAAGALQPVDTTPYEGLELDGTRDFNLSPAAGTVVVNIGNGRLRDTIYRAPREASTAELLIGYTQPNVKAALSGVLTYAIGETRIVPRLTNQQGSEPDIGLLVTQRGHNENGLTRFRSYIIPKSRVIPRDSPFADAASVETYQVTMSNSKKQLWGVPFVVGTHGITDATYEEAIHENPLKIVAWLADGAEDTFLLPTAKPAVSTAKFSIFNFTSGAEVTTGITKSVSQVVFDYPPTDGDILIGVYEYAE